MPSLIWFTEVEEVIYSVVEYIPGLGTLYSLQRANVAYNQDDWLGHWQSVANFLESSVRDIFLWFEVAEPIPAVIIHTMAESFTDKIIEIYHREPKKPQVQVSVPLDKDKGYVLIAESSKGKNKSQIFESKAKGVHQFHRAAFTGILTHPDLAPTGVKIRLDIHQGLFDGAPVTFSWIWPADSYELPNKPEATLGFLQLELGNTTEFTLTNSKGAGLGGGYDFSGNIMSKDQIITTSTMNGVDYEIDFRRVTET